MYAVVGPNGDELAAAVDRSFLHMHLSDLNPNWQKQMESRCSPLPKSDRTVLSRDGRSSF
jgi:hypothetical protein